MEKIAMLLRVSQGSRRGRRGERSKAVAVAVVVTVMVEEVVARVPVALIDDGLIWQAAPAGRPEQERAMVPLNPVEEDTETEVEPDDPGAEIVTVDWFKGTCAKKPGWMVKLNDCVLLLELKLKSPL
jgi:hypothetical protein